MDVEDKAAGDAAAAPDDAEQRERRTTSFRLLPRDRKRLEEAAAASGRSLQAEIEARLETSLRQDYVMFDQMVLKWGFSAAKLMAQMGDVLRDVFNFRPYFLQVDDTVTPVSALRDPWRYDQAVRAALAVLRAHQPAGPVEPPATRVPTMDTPKRTITPAQREALLAAAEEGAERERSIGTTIGEQRVEGAGRHFYYTETEITDEGRRTTARTMLSDSPPINTGGKQK